MQSRLRVPFENLHNFFKKPKNLPVPTTAVPHKLQIPKVAVRDSKKPKPFRHPHFEKKNTHTLLQSSILAKSQKFKFPHISQKQENQERQKLKALSSFALSSDSPIIFFFFFFFAFNPNPSFSPKHSVSTTLFLFLFLCF